MPKSIENSFGKGLSISDDGEEIKISDAVGNKLSRIIYSLNPESLVIHNADSKIQGKGYFSKVFDNLLEIAHSNWIKFITLEVEENNLNAIKIYHKYGFIVNNQIPAEPGFIPMIKYL